MRPSLSDRGQRAERRLFEANTRLEKARAELAVGEEQLATLEAIADELRVRSIVSETACADRDWQQARRHAEALGASLESTRARVRELQALQESLIEKLVGEWAP